MTSDNNLRDNPNPYSSGSPSVDAERESLYPGAGPGDLYFDVRGLPGAGSNPHSQGAPWVSDPRVDATRYMSDNSDSLYGATMGNYRSSEASGERTFDDYEQQYLIDQGLGPDGRGRS